MASVFVRRFPAPPRVWGMLMDYWQVPASLAVTWWRALGRSHHARALAIHMEIDLFAQDNMRLRELIDTALAAPFTPEESQVEEAIYPSLGLSPGPQFSHA
jgi:hypothetical protein